MDAVKVIAAALLTEAADTAARILFTIVHWQPRRKP